MRKELLEASYDAGAETIRLTHGDPGATTLAVTRTQSLVWPQLD